MVTEENKKKFEEWYYSVDNFPQSYIKLDDLFKAPFEMQKGVYESYYDSLGLIIERQTYNRLMVIWDYRIEEPDEEIKIDCTYEEDMNDWWKEAFKQADILVNNNNK